MFMALCRVKLNSNLSMGLSFDGGDEDGNGDGADA
jgi:hypothetical protein